MLDSQFQFFVPIEKGGVAEEKGERLIYGVASTEDLDLDQEIVAASGLKKSLEYFLRHGRIDWDHRSKEEPKFIIGEPVSAQFDVQNRFHLKGRLYKGIEIAEQAWALAKAGCTRLGWSIGGRVLRKSMQFNKSLNKFVPHVVEALINHVALTPHAKNFNTFATPIPYGAFMKSLASSGETIGTVVSLGGKEYVLAAREELEKALSSATGAPVVPESLDSDIKVFRRYVRSEGFTSDADAARRWFKSQGVGEDRADAFAAYISRNAARIAKTRE